MFKRKNMKAARKKIIFNDLHQMQIKKIICGNLRHLRINQ